MIVIHFIQIIFFLLGHQSPDTHMSMAIHQGDPIQVIIDTDANNELDDQHALAYLFANQDLFNIRGVTVNATFNGGAIDQHVAEAERVMKLCDVDDRIDLYAGANGDFESIRERTNETEFDGSDAVNFIISEARKERDQPLVLIPIGKLTNISLALLKAPDIRDKVRIVWLGANYPEPGEYNLVNDIPSMNYLLDQDVSFEIVTVRYGKDSGSDAVRATPDDIRSKLKNAGPKVAAVPGRHGGSFNHFGDYALNLFEKIDLHGDPPSRALFDVVAIAVIKNPDWGVPKVIPAPTMIKNKWIGRPGNQRKVIIWEHFDEEEILKDFYDSLSNF